MRSDVAHSKANVEEKYSRKRRKQKSQNKIPHNYRLVKPKKRALRPIKNRIRDLERLLQNVDKLPANIRAERERELDACYHDLARTEADIKRHNVIKKYHMVRFFDRQKATRRLKQALKALKVAETSEDEKLARKNVHIAEVNLNYSIYHPLERPYNALYPTCNACAGENPSVREPCLNEGKGDPEIWNLVEKAMESGTLTDLRDSLTLKNYDNRLQTMNQYPKSQDITTNRRINANADGLENNDSNDSDNGFFEV